VQTAADGAEGLQLAQALQPAAITLDVHMPGMDGWAVLTALKADARTAPIPVVMLTISGNRELGYALGVVDFLNKPVDRERLLAVLHKYRRDQPQPVLVVEDDAAMRAMLRRLLEKEGWAVDDAANGRAALGCLAQRAPQLILLDLLMPEMNGFEFVEELRRHEAWRGIPVVVITSKDLTADERARLNGHVDKVVQKGAYRREELLAEVHRLIGEAVRTDRS
jgi:CheY-like chemotaxis protein